MVELAGLGGTVAQVGVGAWGLTVNSPTTPPGGDGSGPMRPRPTTPPTGRPTTSGTTPNPPGRRFPAAMSYPSLSDKAAHAGGKAADADPGPTRRAGRSRNKRAARRAGPVTAHSRRAPGTGESSPTVGPRPCRHRRPAGAAYRGRAEPPISSDPMSAVHRPDAAQGERALVREPVRRERLTLMNLTRPYPGDRQKDSAIRIWTDGLRRAARAQHSSRSTCRCRPAVPSACAIRW